MNERITQLAEQARMYALTLENRVDDCNDVFEQKFAELIVKECAKIAGKAEYSDTWLEPVEDAIKKHFGVEE
jgi:hypothetical protein